MSYILDALKKLEKERRRGLIPGLNEQDSVVYYSQRKAVWPYLLGISVFLAAGLLIGWFVLPLSGNRVPPDMAKTLKRTDQDPLKKIGSIPAALPQAQPLPDARNEVKTPVIKSDKAPEKVVAGKSELGKKPAVPVVPEEEIQKSSDQYRKESEPIRTEPKNETPEPPVREKLYKFSELPPSVRDSLKKFFSITAYMYSSTPSERMVRINDHMMREGQELDPGIRIEEITADGVILTYKKFRFFVSVK